MVLECLKHALVFPCARRLLRDLYPFAPAGLIGDGGVRQLVRRWKSACTFLYVRRHTCSLIHVGVGVVATAYPFRIPVKLNQHFSFVFALALWVQKRLIKDTLGTWTRTNGSVVIFVILRITSETRSPGAYVCSSNFSSAPLWFKSIKA